MRRVYHVTTFTVLPVLYYLVIDDIADGMNVSAPKILSVIILLAIVCEFIRIKKRWIVFGMREYERDHISAQTWGTVSMCLVLLLAFPRQYGVGTIEEFTVKSNDAKLACYGQIGIPIIWTLGIGDPLLGELKKFARTNVMTWRTVYLIAWAVLVIVWILCWLWCDTPWWLIIIMPPISIAAEKPSIPHIDDNGLMLLIPLLLSILLESWFSKDCNPIFY